MLKREFTSDGLDPDDAGYAVIEPPAVAAIRKALKAQRVRMHAAKPERNSAIFSAGLLTPCPPCASSLKGK
jgi:hypothetical protein